MSMYSGELAAMETEQKLMDQEANRQLTRQTMRSGLQKTAMANQEAMAGQQQTAMAKGMSMQPPGEIEAAPHTANALKPHTEMTPEQNGLLSWIHHTALGNPGKGESMYDGVVAGSTKLNDDGSIVGQTSEGKTVTIPSHVVHQLTGGIVGKPEVKPLSAEDIERNRQRDEEIAIKKANADKVKPATVRDAANQAAMDAKERKGAAELYDATSTLETADDALTKAKDKAKLKSSSRAFSDYRKPLPIDEDPDVIMADAVRKNAERAYEKANIRYGAPSKDGTPGAGSGLPATPPPQQADTERKAQGFIQRGKQRISMVNGKTLISDDDYNRLSALVAKHGDKMDPSDRFHADEAIKGWEQFHKQEKAKHGSGAVPTQIVTPGALGSTDRRDVTTRPMPRPAMMNSPNDIVDA